MLYKISRESLPALMPDPGGLDQMYTCEASPQEKKGGGGGNVSRVQSKHRHLQGHLHMYTTAESNSIHRRLERSRTRAGRNRVASRYVTLRYAPCWSHLASVVLPHKVLAQGRLLVALHVHEVGQQLRFSVERGQRTHDIPSAQKRHKAGEMTNALFEYSCSGLDLA